MNPKWFGFSKSNPTSDFDFMSVDDDGERIWIEVKATSGRDGRFRWSKAEFDRARKLRSRYIICRVYEADSERPSVKKFRDPVGMLMNDRIRLNVSALNAEVESVLAESEDEA